MTSYKTSYIIPNKLCGQIYVAKNLVYHLVAAISLGLFLFYLQNCGLAPYRDEGGCRLSAAAAFIFAYFAGDKSAYSAKSLFL